jgi:hypothetical protein
VTLPPTFHQPSTNLPPPSTTFHRPVCSTPLYPRGGGTPLHPLERVGRSTSCGWFSAGPVAPYFPSRATHVRCNHAILYREVSRQSANHMQTNYFVISIGMR